MSIRFQLKSSLLLIKVLIKKKIPKSIIISINKIIKFHLFHEAKSKYKVKKLQKQRIVEFSDILFGLRKIGIKPGMTVMVHSSLSGLGYVEGGATTIIDALIEVVGQEGTILMPTPPKTGANLEAIIRGDIFYPESTPCVTGKISETFRKISGVYRSFHPTHSITAFGKEAKWITEGHHKDATPFGSNSPFARLLEMDGCILGLGLDVRYITFYHHYEDIAIDYPVNVYSDEKYSIPVAISEGKNILVSTPVHDPLVSSFRLNNDDKTLKEVSSYLSKYGNLKKGKVGHGDSFLIKAQDIIYSLEKMKENGNKTIYNMELIKLMTPKSLNKNT